MPSKSLSEAELVELEAFAVELARIGGHAATGELQRAVAVEYKTELQAAAPRDPVSEVDVAVERRLRKAIGAKHPEHGLLGEELGAERLGARVVWAIDPIDGTTNYIHRYPLFAVSLGCIVEGEPVVGAVWCSSSHALRAGVYHARAGGPLAFDGLALDTERRQAIRRPLLGAMDGRAGGGDVRQSGSAAIECAFVAAGVLLAARLSPLWPWDVAGGIALLRAAKRQVLVPDGSGGAAPFERFEPPLERWRKPLWIGEARGLELFEDGDGATPPA